MKSFLVEQMDVFMTEMTSWCSFKLLIKSFVGIVAGARLVRSVSSGCLTSTNSILITE